MLEGIKLILENNIFHFNGAYFIQTKGTAMGSKFAPIYSSLVLVYLEEKLYEMSEIEFDSDFRSYLEEHFKRFLFFFKKLVPGIAFICQRVLLTPYGRHIYVPPRAGLEHTTARLDDRRSNH